MYRQDNSPIPSVIKCNAINLFNFKARGADEQICMKDDLVYAVNNFIDLNSCMQASAAAATTPRRQAIINKQFLKLEAMMLILSLYSQRCYRATLDYSFYGGDIDLNDTVMKKTLLLLIFISSFDDTDCVEGDDE